MHRSYWARLSLFALLLSSSPPATTAAAEPATDEEKPWEVVVAPYLWGQSVTGDVTIAGTTESVDVPFRDILSMLNIGLMGVVEARYKRWILVVDGVGALLEDEGSVGLLGYDVDTSMATVTVSGGYRVFSGPRTRFFRVPPEANPKNLDVDLLVGGRYWYLRNQIDLSLGGITLPPSFTLQEDWVDPIVGARIRAQLSERFSLQLRASVGGFGVGSASEFTWGALAAVGWKFGRRWTAFGGYRALAFDRDFGGTNNMNLTFHGPLLGVSYRFGGAS
jgi:hypothetical protein